MVNDTDLPAQTSPRGTLSKLLTIAGVTVSIAAVAFVFRALVQNWATVVEFDYSSMNFWATLGSIIFYVLCIGAAAANWAQIVKALAFKVTTLGSISVFLVAQLGRYLPGNVGHYFGRMTLGKSVGVSLKTAGIGSIIEVMAALCAGGMIFLCVFLFLPDTFAQALSFLPEQATPLRVLLLVFLVLAAAAFATKIMGDKSGSAKVSKWVWIRATGLAALSLLLTGVSFALFVHSMTPLSANAFGLTLVVFSMAWLAGFVTPGAPAGLGIREAVLLAFLAPVFGAATAVSVSILHRMMCTAVDILTSFAGWASYVKARSRYDSSE